MYFNVQFDVRVFWHGVLLNPHNTNTPFGKEEKNGMEKKEYFKNIISFPLFESLNRRT